MKKCLLLIGLMLLIIGCEQPANKDSISSTIPIDLIGVWTYNSTEYTFTSTDFFITVDNGINNCKGTYVADSKSITFTALYEWNKNTSEWVAIVNNPNAIFVINYQINNLELTLTDDGYSVIFTKQI